MSPTSPITISLEYSQLNENGGPKIAEQLSANMRLLLKATSPFLNKENFNMLLSAIEAVNKYKPERGNDLKVKANLGVFLFSNFSITCAVSDSMK